MAKKTQTILLASLIFLILVFAGLNLALSRYGAFWRRGEVSQAPTPTPVSEAGHFELPSFSSPVEKEYLSQVKFVQLNFGQNELGFYLEEGSSVYATTEGTVDIVEGEWQILFLLPSDAQIGYFRYLFPGETQVEKGTKVKGGDVLGKVGKDFLPVATGDRNLIVGFFKTALEGISLDQAFVDRLE